MIEDASRRPSELHLLGMMADGPSGYVEGLEADGQRQLVDATELMPRNAPWSALEELGFASPTPTDDKLFVRTRLPEGWRKVPSDHPMWSYVEDERGLRRVSIFYKAAYYDRRADAHVVDVGRELASVDLYAEPDGPHHRDAADPHPSWNALTDAERRDYLAEVDDYLVRCKRHPEVYGRRRARAEALRETAERLVAGG